MNPEPTVRGAAEPLYHFPTWYLLFLLTPIVSQLVVGALAALGLWQRGQLQLLAWRARLWLTRPSYRRRRSSRSDLGEREDCSP